MKSQQKASDYSLKDRQVQKLIEGAGSYRDRIIIKLMAFGGLRRAEVVNLQVQNIDSLQRRVHVVGKGDKQRFVPLPVELILDLKNLAGHKKTGWLFPSKYKPGFPLATKAINQIVDRAAQQAKLKSPNPQRAHLNPHLLRHTFARKMKKEGLSPDALQQIMGHASFATTMDIYGRKSVDDIQEEIEKIFDK